MSNPKGSSDIRLSVHVSPEPTDDELKFVTQLGIPCVFTWAPDSHLSFESLDALKTRVESYRLILYNVGCMRLGKSPNIHLALPDRNKDIDEFCRFVENLGRTGIFATTFTWEPDQVWSTGTTETRGGALTRFVDQSDLVKTHYTHGRQYTREELWDNFRYFMKRIMPVAESCGVRLALHPNDPPVEEIAGIPCLIRSFDDYRKAFEIAQSDHLGMEFCTGCWLEGGRAFGDIFEAIEYFTRKNRIYIVHFRNVSSPLPSFTETFLDDGYMDMYKIMKAFHDHGYAGSMTYDHSPRFVDSVGSDARTAFAIGYMKALLHRIES